MGSEIVSKDLLTTGDVARICGVSAQAVTLWIRRGCLNAYCTPGGHRRVSRKNLGLFLRERGHPAAADLTGPARVLVVDDDVLVLQTTLRVLARLNGSVRVEGVSDGTQALLRLGAIRPDVVILDLHMPGLNGREVLRRLREMPDIGARVVVLSGYLTPALEEELLGMGATACLAKPPDIHTLLHTVRSALRDGVARSPPAVGR